MGTSIEDRCQQTAFDVTAVDGLNIKLSQCRKDEMIEFLAHVTAIAWAPAGAVMLKPGLGDLADGLAAGFSLATLLTRAAGAWIDAALDPAVELQSLPAGLSETNGGVWPDGEGAACSLPAVVLTPGLGA